MKFWRHIVHVFLFVLVSVSALSQTENELKENANKLFEKEQYIDATSIFLRLLSLNPKNSDYNYKYGTCLLFNSYQKKEAIRYLNYAVKDASIDPRAYYFHGKALHLNYQFSEAKKSYQTYLQKREKRDKRYNVEREIEMCDNGKKLLSTFTDIIVSEKTEIDKEKFFRLYKNLGSIGGNILVSADFQSKLDKKYGHVPVVHYPDNAKAIYYSSYGDSDETGKDIYVRKRLPNNKWGAPQRLPNTVNSSEDEDFPFMHSSGKVLYFSSKGHNSMGGYDVFSSKCDVEANSYNPPKNVDFAISSPDDDLFYAVDSLYQNAYFASARQSQGGKLHVYQVRVARIPIQEVIIMGDFLSEVNPSNKKMNVTVKSHASGQEVGRFTSNDSGKYSFVFPKGGKYDYQVKVEGSEDLYTFVVDLPIMDDIRPLKQKAVHTTVDGNEMVRIINLFDDNVEGVEALIAEVIRKRAELDVNIDKFDLKEIDAQAERNEVLAELGFNNMTLNEVSGKLEELAISEKLNEEKVKRIERNINAEIVEKSLGVIDFDQKSEELESLIGQASDPAEKHRLLTEQLRVENEKQQLAEEIKGLEVLKNESVETANNTNGNGPKMEAVEKEFNALKNAGNEKEALSLLAKNKETIDHVRTNSPNKIVDELIAQSVDLKEEVDGIHEKQMDYEKSIDQLEAQILLLKNSLPDAKKKDVEGIKSDIAEKQEEIKMFVDLADGTKESITEKNKRLSVLDNNIASLQKAMLEENVEVVSNEDVLASMEEVNNTLEDENIQVIENELQSIESTNPQLSPTYVPEENSVVAEVNNEKAKFESQLDERMQEINGNSALTDEEKINQKQTVNKEVLENVNARLTEINGLITAYPEAENLTVEKVSLENFIEQLEANESEFESELASINNNSSETSSLTRSNVLNSVQPNYAQEIESIESNNALTEEEKLSQIQNLDKRTVAALKAAISENQEALQSNVENELLVEKNEILESLLADKQASVDDREIQLKSFNNQPVTESAEQVKEELTAELNTGYLSKKEQLQNSSDASFDAATELLELEQGQLVKIQNAKNDLDNQLENEPDNNQLKVKADVLAQLEKEQTTLVEEQRTNAIESISEEQLNEVISSADPKYRKEVDKLKEVQGTSVPNDLAEREVELQEKLQDAADKVKKDLERSYSVSADLEQEVIGKAITASKLREEGYRAEQENVVSTNTTENTTVKTEDEFISEMRTVGLNGDSDALSATYETIDELKAQEQILAYYNNQLTQKIADKESTNTSSETNKDELAWLNAEKQLVEEKRRRIGISIGELEQVAVTTNPNSSKAESELAELARDEQDLMEQMNNESLSNNERKEASRKIKELRSKKVKVENEVIENQLKEGEQANQGLESQLEEMSDVRNNNEIIKNAFEVSESKSVEIQDLLMAAEDAKSEEEKNFLLKQAQDEQAILNDQLNEVVISQKRAKIEEENDIQLLSEEELQKLRRTYSVQIGELTTEIIRTDKNIQSAKKKDIEGLETKRNSLIQTKELVESKLHAVEERLTQVERKVPVVNPSALEEEMTFNEERTLAGTENYKEYYEVATVALGLEQEIDSLETLLGVERAEITELLSLNVENKDDIEARAMRIKELESEVDRVKIDLVQAKYKSDELLSTNTNDAMKMQNLVTRGIKPLKPVVVAAALIHMPSNGFAFNENTESVYSESNPIPVDVESPSGLVYRVQVGAFAKPIPQNLYKEFSPVSGEKISGTNITRYMAGFFNSSDVVVNAREQIRELGYADAFIVAYCDGERIGFGDARRREAEGTCVPKGANELVTEVVEKTARKLGLPTTAEVPEVPEYSYNQSPGAAEADPIELKKGLFFTVQVGVFNRPVGSESIFFMKELITLRLPNGQIRYSTGMFNSIEEAKPRRTEALKRGVKGAFITAYYQGERITLGEAKKLLAENGNSILQSEIEKSEEVVKVETPVNVHRTDSVSVENVKTIEEFSSSDRIQIVTKKTFDEFPRDVLNRYNAEGNFFFDAKDKHVKSVIYEHEDDLPRLWNFKEDIDTVYIPISELEDAETEILTVTINDSVVPGDFMDWLLRFNYHREWKKESGRMILTIFGIEPNEVEMVQKDIRTFGLEAVVREETVIELELKENE